MAWKNLREELDEEFADLSGRPDDVEAALEQLSALKRQNHREWASDKQQFDKQWVERKRALSRASMKKLREDPEYRKKWAEAHARLMKEKLSTPEGKAEHAARIRKWRASSETAREKHRDDSRARKAKHREAKRALKEACRNKKGQGTIAPAPFPACAGA